MTSLSIQTVKVPRRDDFLETKRLPMIKTSGEFQDIPIQYFISC